MPRCARISAASKADFKTDPVAANATDAVPSRTSKGLLGEVARFVKFCFTGFSEAQIGRYRSALQG